MKTMKSILAVFLLISSLVFMGCNKDDDPVDLPTNPLMSNTIVDIASGDENFSILVRALQKAGLDGTLASEGDYTVFAPTNDAFNTLFTGLGVSGIDDLSADALKPILLYHVMGQKATAEMISAGYYSSLSPAHSSYLSLFVQTASGVKINNSANVTSADLMADNGVIHVIDQVLLPPTVVDIATANSDFSTLVDAVVAEGLDGALSDKDASFTVFAPTNDAFAKLSNLPSDLSPVLLYHVLGASVFSSDISSSIVNTLNEQNSELVIEMNGGMVRLNGMANVVAADIVGVNGVIHVIDEVITPIDNNSILDIAMANGFNSLTAALAKTNLASTFLKPGDYTVFAPTDDAFAAFLSEAGFSSLESVPNDALTNILYYHVIGTKVMSTGLSSGYANTLLQSFDESYVGLLVDLNNGVKINSSMVTSADIEANNGVVHIVDKVLSPPTVVDIAINNPSFSILVEAVIKAGLAETLMGDGPFTVFAPTNEAFNDLFAVLGVSGVADLTAEQLVPILQYHVVGDNVLSKELIDGNVQTLNGDIAISTQPPKINSDSDIIIVDVQGTNGVVHAISKVLLPPSK